MLVFDNCKRSNIRYSTQWIAALGGFLVCIQLGLHYGWVSPNIVRFTAVNSEIPLTKDQISWLVACSYLSELAGVLFGFISNKYLGSKNTAILVLISFSFNWICLIIANSIEWIFAARLISGMACGMAYFYFPFHLGEISSPKIRGTLITVAASSLPVGLVIITLAETYLTMKISSTIYLIQCLFTIILFFWLKDSPYELEIKGNHECAKISIAFYNPKADIEKELNEVKNFVELHHYHSLKDKLQALNIPSRRKSLFLLLILSSLSFLTGIINLVPYLELILIKAKLNIIKPGDLVIYIYIMRVIFGYSIVTLIDVLGRRIVLIMSSIATATGMAGLALHFYLLDLSIDTENFQWLPITSLLLCFVIYSVGYTAVPSAILSEHFPTSLKSIVTFINTMWISLLSFVITKSFQPMVDLIGETYVFSIHAALSLLAVPYALLLLPETKGKTFQEIQLDLNKK